MTSGQFLQQKRQSLQMTQLELSKIVGYEQPQFISLIENGHSPLPVYKIKTFAEALKFEPSDKKKFLQLLAKEYIDKLNEAII